MQLNNSDRQNYNNKFILLMCHMKRGNTLCRKIPLSLLPQNMIVLINDDCIEYFTIVPLRNYSQKMDEVILATPELT
jgi:hypothetical protein